MPLLGKSIPDPDLVAYIDRHQCTQSGLNWTCAGNATELAESSAGRIIVVHMFKSGSNATRYPGPLPAGLTWTDTRADVERKLGQPASHGLDFARYEIDGRLVFVDYAPPGQGSTAELIKVQVQVPR